MATNSTGPCPCTWGEIGLSIAAVGFGAFTVVSASQGSVSGAGMGLAGMAVTLLMVSVVFEQQGHAFDDDPYIRRQRLPKKAWDGIQDAIRRGKRERGVNLKVVRTYRIDSPRQQAFESVKQSFGNAANVTTLFHGTSSASVVQSIVRNGFRLPPNHGQNMFGPGIYFARNPQKSYDYTSIGGYILVCDVILGVTKKVREPKPHLDPRRDLKKSSWVFWTKDCDSAHAPAGASTVSDEHIIFSPARVLPRYLIQVEKI